MLDAIVYCSKCGHTKAYAEALADQLHLPVYSLKEALSNSMYHAKILFLGWVRENIIQGLEKTGHFSIDAVVAVGIRPFSQEMLQELKTENHIPVKLFYLRGGIDLSKLSWKDKWLIKSIERHLQFKQYDSFLTKEEQVLYHCIHNQRNDVSLESLKPILKHYLKSENSIS